MVPFGSFTQGEYDKCYFGTAAVDFGNVVPSSLTDSGMEARESAASMCDHQGNLLFYSNGGNSPTSPGVIGAIWNANHEIMDNGVLGDSSGCISSFQGAIAIPSPAINDQNKVGNNIYYLFTKDCLESSYSAPNYNSGLTYSLIDMDASDGLGKVIEKNQIVVPFSTGGTSIKTNHEPITAVRKENNIDWWIFSYNNDSLYSIELTDNGTGNYQSYDISEGAIVISPSRDKLIAGDRLYDFNASNGQLNYLMTLEVQSASFSSDGTKLYSLFNGNIYQYNIEANDIENSKTEIASVSGINRLFLAPDTRVYLYRSESNSIPGYIECSNNNSSDVGVSMNAIDLYGKESGRYFTNIPACYLYNSSNQCRVSVEETKKSQQKIRIYPNPSKNEVNIGSDNFLQLKAVKICDFNGQKMIGKNMNECTLENCTINISNLSSGVYFVHSIFKDEVAVNKLVVE